MLRLLLLGFVVWVLSNPLALRARSAGRESAEKEDLPRPLPFGNMLAKALLEPFSVPDPVRSALAPLLEQTPFMTHLQNFFDPTSLRREIEIAANPRRGRGFGEKGNDVFVQWLIQELRNAGLDNEKWGCI